MRKQTFIHFFPEHQSCSSTFRANLFTSDNFDLAKVSHFIWKVWFLLIHITPVGVRAVNPRPYFQSLRTHCNQRKFIEILSLMLVNAVCSTYSMQAYTKRLLAHLNGIPTNFFGELSGHQPNFLKANMSYSK